jgi:sortase A
MRRALRLVGIVMVAAGVLALAWVLVVWQWQDPVTALYTKWQQHRLAGSYHRLVEQYHPPKLPRKVRFDPAAERRAILRAATAFRRQAHEGQAIGRIVIGRLGLKMVLVNGTDADTLRKGPGRDPETYMPGQNRLVYIAGHRTTYLAPFSHIEEIHPGDVVRLEMPYATFVYRATHHRIVEATDLSVLRSPRHELLELQACHPRFFASHRYIVYAKLVRVEPRNGRPFNT